MTLSLGPPPTSLLVSWQKYLIVIPELEHSGRYTIMYV